MLKLLTQRFSYRVKRYRIALKFTTPCERVHHGPGAHTEYGVCRGVLVPCDTRISTAHWLSSLLYTPLPPPPSIAGRSPFALSRRFETIREFGVACAARAKHCLYAKRFETGEILRHGSFVHVKCPVKCSGGSQ